MAASLSANVRNRRRRPDKLIGGIRKNYELPKRHDLVAYAFDVDGQRYTSAHASESCNSTAKGQHISVYYDAQKPAENTTDDPQSDLNEGFLLIVFEGVIVIHTCSGNMFWCCPARI
jgi:hypothetical protein